MSGADQSVTNVEIAGVHLRDMKTATKKRAGLLLCLDYGWLMGVPVSLGVSAAPGSV